MIWQDIIIQVIGYVGLIFAVFAFQCSSHKKVMVFRTLNEVFFAVQYICLGSYTGAAMNIIGGIRNMGFAKCVESGKSTKKLQILFSAIFLVSGLMTSSGLISIMVIGAKVISTIAYGMKNTKYIRFLTLPTSTCWLIYNASCLSWAGVICEALTIISIIAAIIRLDIIPNVHRHPTKKRATRAKAV